MAGHLGASSLTAAHSLLVTGFAITAAPLFKPTANSVSYVGQPVAVVVARDRYVARDAVDLIQVDYEPLRPILDPLEAAREDSSPIHEHLGTNIALRVRHIDTPLTPEKIWRAMHAPQVD
jgi:CO/xanthine dehydrogenase Mo-binding subunit